MEKRRAARRAVVGLLLMAAAIVGAPLTISKFNWIEAGDSGTLKIVIAILIYALCYYLALIMAFSNATRLENLIAKEKRKRCETPHSG